ncbi:MAG: hydrogenase maturation protease [Deltaproteobacteria bacterium]|nr:hydrogenase maturation protease [Deltaproteobacteria bacterium]
MTRIVCVGNRWVAADAAGPRVHDRLAAAALPPGVELVDGGLGGLDLAPLVEGAERVVFVDAVAGFAAPGDFVVLEGPALEAIGAEPFGHGAGLAWLLRALPLVCETGVPRVAVVGLEAPVDDDAVARASAAALRLAEAAP